MKPRQLLPAVLLLTGCSMPTLPTLPGVTPYHMDVQQGNVVTQEMISKLKPGMSRSQVRFALGTPLVVDPFRTNRWDYVFRYEKAGRLVEHQRIAVIFEGDKLVRIEGDVVAVTPLGAVKPPASKPESASAAKPPAPQSPAQPAVAAGATGAGDAPADGAALPKAEAQAQPAAEKPAEERGWFGRMLERMGF
jgi:outer membrane protein assembly factor BamE